MKKQQKRQKRAIRHKRVRAKIRGTAHRPRFSIFRSNKHIFVQLINDINGIVLFSASDQKIAKGKKTEAPVSRGERLGEYVAQEAIKKGISKVVFDRGGYAYHGVVKALAEGARKGGLKL